MNPPRRGPHQEKRHLIKTRGAFVRTACGLRNPPLTTHDLAQVTCRACQRTLFMADAEMRSRQRRRSTER